MNNLDLSIYGIKMGNVSKKHQPIDELQMASERPARVEEDRSTSDRSPLLAMAFSATRPNG